MVALEYQITIKQYKIMYELSCTVVTTKVAFIKRQITLIILYILLRLEVYKLPYVFSYVTKSNERHFDFIFRRKEGALCTESSCL